MANLDLEAVANCQHKITTSIDTYFDLFKFLGISFTVKSDAEYVFKCPKCVGSIKLNMHALGGPIWFCSCGIQRDAGSDVIHLVGLLMNIPASEIQKIISSMNEKKRVEGLKASH